MIDEDGVYEGFQGNTLIQSIYCHNLEKKINLGFNI
jgi:hypothetical protein